jgi:hypothetical protein
MYYEKYTLYNFTPGDESLVFPLVANRIDSVHRYRDESMLSDARS